MAAIRICFVGDSITAGTGDARFLGWPGRVSEAAKGRDITLYNLGVRADTSEMIAARWQAECRARLPETVDGRLIFSFGVNDAADMKGVGIRVPRHKSEAIARDMLRQAKKWLPTLWIGPVPVADDRMPFIGPGVQFDFNTERCGDLNAAYAKIAAELDIPYLDIFTPLAANPGWIQAQRDCDGIHPTARGYDILADLIAAWPAWQAWLKG